MSVISPLTYDMKGLSNAQNIKKKVIPDLIATLYEGYRKLYQVIIVVIYTE